MKQLLLLCLVSLFMQHPAWALPFDDAVAAHEREDYAKSINILRPLAVKGDAHAQYMLGTMYGLGQGVVMDAAERVKWWTLAAEQGDASAQAGLGVVYGLWFGAEYDIKAAMKWNLLAAAQGHAGAQYQLGFHYLLNSTQN